MVRFIMLLLGSFSSNFAFAASQDVEITGIGISQSTGTVYIGVTPEISSGPCTHKSQVRVSLTDSIIGKEVYAAALTAFAASKVVNIAYDDSAGADCLFNNPVIRTFYIRR